MTAHPASTERRVALLNDTSFYVGPALARALAQRGHDLVIGDPVDGLAEELRAIGAQVEVTGVRSLRTQDEADALVNAAIGRFGRIDAAAVFSGDIVTGPFLASTDEQLQRVYKGCVEAPYHPRTTSFEP